MLKRKLMSFVSSTTSHPARSTQLVINTAIVYMHRFYTFNSFTKFHRNASFRCNLLLFVVGTPFLILKCFFPVHFALSVQAISSCAVFLAAKVEEQPRKLEHVIKVSHLCIYRESVDTKSEVICFLFVTLSRPSTMLSFTFPFTAIPTTGFGSCLQRESNASHPGLQFECATSSHHRGQLLPAG